LARVLSLRQQLVGFAKILFALFMKKVRVTLTMVAPTAAKLVSAANLLRTHGVTIESVLDNIGVITAAVPADKLPIVKQLEGLAVEEEQTFQLPSPNDPVQ